MLQNVGKGRYTMFTSNNHARACNQVLAIAGVPLKFVGKKANFAQMRKHMMKYKRPIILGTYLTGGGGHIILLIGCDDKGFLVSDPYGEYPYRKKNGFRQYYTDKGLRGKISKAIYLEDTK